MPELRKDPVVGRWVIIATERARRPGNILDRSYSHPGNGNKECIFCNHYGDPICEYRLPEKQKTDHWDVAVFPFQKSFLQVKEPLKHHHRGLYEVTNAFGRHELVLETPDHISNMADLPESQIQLIIQTYVSRILEYARNPYFQYAMVYKNYGAVAGGRNIAHTRSHIMATPVNPLRVRRKLAGAKKYYEENHSCVYCDIVKTEVHSRERLIEETDHFLVIIPFAARFLFEMQILPKLHHCDFTTGVDGHEQELALLLKRMLMKLKIGLDDPAYNFFIQTAPFRRSPIGVHQWATIEQDFHWHIELMPRLTLMAGFEKGTGFYINSVPPEHAAQYLREVKI
jgi:UDPglucose--hexose-1-phosphate uridylyltransferase